MHLLQNKNFTLIAIGVCILVIGSSALFISSRLNSQKATKADDSKTTATEQANHDEAANIEEHNHAANPSSPTPAPSPTPPAPAPAPQPTPKPSPSPSSPSPSPSPPPPAPTPPPPPPTPPPPVTHTVTYNGSTFSPASKTINNGDSIKFVNSSGGNVWPASNPHPSHSIYPAFDPGSSIGPGGNWTFTFTQVGSWGYHNHHNSGQTGTIIVQ